VGYLTGEISGVSVNGPRELRLPGNLNVSFEGIEADSLIVAMRRFALQTLPRMWECPSTTASASSPNFDKRPRPPE